jgi:hypothetical protein
MPEPEEQTNDKKGDKILRRLLKTLPIRRPVRMLARISVMKSLRLKFVFALAQ